MHVSFSEPQLKKVKRVIEYELKGVAFIDTNGKGTVGFTFESDYGMGFRLIMEGSYYGKFLYDYFRAILDKYAVERSGLTKPFGELYATWRVPKDRLTQALDELSKSMGKEWAKGLGQSSESIIKTCDMTMELSSYP